MLLRVHGLLEEELGSGKFLLFAFNFEELILYSRDVLLWEFVTFRVDQAEIPSVKLNHGSEKLLGFGFWVSDQLELLVRGVCEALVLGELFDVELELRRLQALQIDDERDTAVWIHRLLCREAKRVFHCGRFLSLD